jgi:hypothetical protein
MHDDVAYLDSALFYIDEVFGKCKKDDPMMALRKLQVYAYQHDMSNAIKFISTLDSSLFYPFYYKNLLLNRFKAMAAQEKGDTLNKNIFLENIVSDIKEFISLHQDELDTLMQSQSILQSPYSFAPIQFYYYKSQIEGIEKINTEIDSLQQAINGDEEYFWMIRTGLQYDLMAFTGF